MSAMLQRDQAFPVSPTRTSVSIRWVIGILGLLVLLLVILVLSRLASDPLRFPVSNVDVLGTLDYTDREQLRLRVQRHTGRGFYALDIDAIRRAVEAMPWVATAHVRRVWPARVMINVEEHEPAARWNADSLISKRLELFVPPQLEAADVSSAEWRSHFAALPQLRGDVGRHEAVLDAYRRYQIRLENQGATLDSLSEDERRSQTLELSNQVTVRLGYEQHQLRLDRFIDIYDRLVKHLDGRSAKFDMRYSNGFALSGVGVFSRGS